MPVSFWKFARETGASARTSATKTNARFVAFIAGPLTVIAAHLGISWLVGDFQEALKMTWVPIAILGVMLIVFLFYHSYCVYWKSETERENKTKELEDFKKPKLEIIGPTQVLNGPVSSMQTYRIRVRNASGNTVKRCRLRLMSSIPKISEEPLTLFFNNAWAGGMNLHEVDLSPGDEWFFIVYETVGSQFFLRCYDRIEQKPHEKITLNFSLIGEDTSPLKFNAMVDPVSESVVSIVLVGKE